MKKLSHVMRVIIAATPIMLPNLQKKAAQRHARSIVTPTTKFMVMTAQPCLRVNKTLVLKMIPLRIQTEAPRKIF
jgi:hypothetical protein